MSLRQDVRDLRPVLGMLGLRRWLLVRAVALGSLTLAASVALAGTAAWLIVRASQMPPVMYLNVAAVGVRTFGVLRGVSRYLDRLAAHDLALSGVAELRTTLYERLSQGRTERLATLRRGDLLARVGADVDDVGDVVVRALVPGLVAVVVSVGSVIALALFWVPAALVLLGCLVLSAVVVPVLASRADARAEAARVAVRSRIAVATESLVSRAAELALTGRRDAALAELDTAHRDAAGAERLAARPLAAAAATAALSTGLAVLGALLVAVPAAVSGALTATELGVVVLLPLAVFEATLPLPAAVSQLRRSAQAARRITALLAPAPAAPAPAAAPAPPAPTHPAENAPESRIGRIQHSPASSPSPTPAENAGRSSKRPIQQPGAFSADGGGGSGGGAAGGAGVRVRGLVAGWPGGDGVTLPLDLDVPAGTSLAIVGPSGIGKTTLLLTLAGMLPPRSGTVTIDGLAPGTLHGAQRAEHVALTAEDAHVFTTSVLENLRVARGDLTREEAAEVLAAAGLLGWVEQLPDGLDNTITGETISGGERRRLLVARALASPAPLLLLDEPAEHLPDAVATALVRDLLALTAHGRSVVVVTHHLDAVASADAVVRLAAPDASAEGASGDRVEAAEWRG